MTSELEKMMEDDAAENEKRLPTSEELENISDLAIQQKNLEALIAEREKETAELKKRLNRISELALPTAMESVGLMDFRLADGSSITIKKSVFAAIRANQTEGAVRWLDENDLGGIVKDEVKVKFGRGEAQMAKSIMELADELGVSAEEKLFVHPQTLAATIKDMRAKGVEFPEEYFSVADKQKSVVK